MLDTAHLLAHAYCLHNSGLSRSFENRVSIAEDEGWQSLWWLAAGHRRKAEDAQPVMPMECLLVLHHIAVPVGQAFMLQCFKP